MNWHDITVPRRDLGLALEAIGLGGGTVTATKLSGEDVTITYVTIGGSSNQSPQLA